MDIWLILYALTFLFAIPRIKWHRKPIWILEKDTPQAKVFYEKGNRKHKFGIFDPTYTFQPSTADSWLDSFEANTNKGTEIYLYLDTYSASIRRPILKFDMSSQIVPGSKINSATLSLYYYTYLGTNPVGRTYWAYRITQILWTEGGATWNKYDGTNSWATAGGDYTTTDGASAVVPSAYGWMNWTVTVQVQYAVDNVNRVAHFLCRDATEGTAPRYAAQFYSKEYATDLTKRPKLYVDWVVPPTAPTNCSVSILSETSLRVSWTDASTDEDDFHVERKTGAGGTYAEVQIVTSTTKTTTGTVYTWDNSGLLISTTYYYQVRAHRHSDNIYSSYSNEAYNTTPFYAPTNLVAIALNIDAILVQWNDNSQVESDYHLERKTSVEPTWAERTTVPANSTQFTDPGLDPAVVYTYRVRAHNHAQDIYTTYSNEASEAPKLLAQIPFNPLTPLLGYY